MRWSVVVVVLALAFAAVVIASSMLGDSGAAHTMPDGQTMDGSSMTPSGR